MKELRQILRALRRAPWYSATVIGVMALSLTLAIVVFAVVDGVLFKPLPYPQSSQLFAIDPGFPEFPETMPARASPADLAAWSEALPGVALTGVSARWSGDLGDEANSPLSGVGQVLRNFFDVIGVRPMLGGFDNADYLDRSRIWPVIITYEFWESKFTGDLSAVGRTIV